MFLMSLNPHEWSCIQFTPVKPLTSPFITKFEVTTDYVMLSYSYALTIVIIEISLTKITIFMIASKKL